MKLNLDWNKSLELLTQEPVLRRLAQLVNLLLILLLAATLADLTWKLLPTPPLEAPPLSSAGGGLQ
ncbi:MAG: type II secretion system protein GspC, partial [Gammaproteobacteria bacterium]